MFTCEHCQPLLLPYLYDALERDERRQVKEHVEACAACRAALEKTETQRGLLAEAVKDTFTDVRFAPPSDTAKRLGEPTIVLQPSRRRRAVWGRWAMAAAVLLAVLGGGYLTLSGWGKEKDSVVLAKNRLGEVQTDAQAREAKWRDEQKKAQDDIRAIQEQINKLVGDWNQETQKAQQRVMRGHERVQIQGPKSVQAGGHNEFTIHVPRDAKKIKPLAAARTDLVARVVDEKSKKVLVEKKLGDKGDFKFDLPRDLPVGPGAQLALEVESTGEAPFKIRETLPLVAPEYLTHLTTDRPMYRPGETVRFRSLTLERFSLKPPADDLSLRFVITAPNGGEIHKTEGKATLVLDGNQEPLKGPDGQILRGIGAGEFMLPPGLAGGQYTITLTDAKDRFPAEKRTFLVNNWQTPKLNKELHFTKSSYGPGDRVEFQAKASRVEGGAVANQLVTVRAQVDGREVVNFQINTDGEGKLKAGFDLPAKNLIPSGDGVVSLMFHDGGVETLVRPIPIVLSKLRVLFHPEGGDLVAGVPNRVYFQVRTTLDKPADLVGRIVDETGTEVAKIETQTVPAQPELNHGLGTFTFIPQTGKDYELKIDRPIGMEGRYPLLGADGKTPLRVQADGVALNIPKGVVGQTIDVMVNSAKKDRQLLVGAYCRGRLLDHVQVTAKAGQPTGVPLQTSPGVSGVYRVTVFEKIEAGKEHEFVPVAERLIYRPADQKLNVTLKADKSSYVPGEGASVGIQSLDEKNRAKAAIMLVYVVDLSVLKLADDKTHRLMPTHFLLTREVQKPEDLENADFLLGDQPEAKVALDLLLGTQGWRRFAEQDPDQFQKRRPAEASRVLLAMAQKITPEGNPVVLATNKVDDQYSPKFVELQKGLGEQETKETQAQQETVQVVQTRGRDSAAAQAKIDEAQASLRNYEWKLGVALVAILGVAAILAALICIVLGIRSVSQERPAAGWFVGGAAIFLVLFLSTAVGFVIMWARTGQEVGALRAAKAADEPRPQMAEKIMAPDVDAMQKDHAPMMLKGAQVPMVPEAIGNAPGGIVGANAQGKVAMPGIPGPPAVRMKAGRPAIAKAPLRIEMEGPVMGLVAPGGGGGAMPGGFKGGGGFGGQADQAFFPADVERQLRKEGNFQQMLQMRLGRPVQLPTGLEPLVVREYAHSRQPKADDGVRSDFTETLYWNPALVLADGNGKVSFDLSDSITRFQVVALAHSLDGRLGAGTLEIASKLPFSLDPQVPIEVTSSDKITLPVTVKNDGQQDTVVQVRPTDHPGLDLVGEAGSVDLSLKAGQRGRRLFQFKARPVGQPATAALRIEGKTQDGLRDLIERKFKVVPDGFPVAKSVSGLLENSASHVIDLPERREDMVAGSLQVKVSAYPSTLAELQKGLESFLREPCGCFEQSSSSNYPNVMILNYMRDTRQANPQLEQRSQQLLKSGYQQLTSFECMPPADRATKRGYEWFGQTAPPHEALTAYGLLQFVDMAKVFDVDKQMVERTRKYLLDQRDGKGGFKRNPQALDSFGRAPEHITNAYITWSLASTGNTEIEPELAQLLKQAKDPQRKEPYFLSLVSLSCLHAGKTKEAVELLKEMQSFQKDDGHLAGARTSITGSGGRDLDIEATALGLLAWLKANRPEAFNQPVQKAAKWLGQQRSGHGGFGSTQSTILALKALIAFTRDNQKTGEAGEMRLFVADRQGPAVVHQFPAGVKDTIELTFPAAAEGLQPGKNKIRLEVTGNTTFPYTLAWSYNAIKPANVEGCPVHLTAKLDQKEAKEGDTVRLTATIENKTGKGQGMAVAIIGLPGGLTLPKDMAQLKNLYQLQDGGTKPGKISFAELHGGRELVLYWRDLAPDAKITVNLDLICELPGEYRGPASRAYLYYNADRRFWTEPLAIAITPKE